MKKKTLISSLLTLVMCLALIAGSTYALFTSEDEINIAVTSGKVNVQATILTDSLTTSSLEIAQTNGAFANGGSASFTAGDVEKLTLTNMTPGDEVSFKIQLVNTSTVAIIYRLTWAVEGELYEYLVATATEGAVANKIVNNTTPWTEWAIPADGSDEKEIDVTISLPETVGNEAQDKTAEISFVIEAVQANAFANVEYVLNTEQLQNALDNAVPGTTIQLHPGVDYGTVYLRPSTANTEVTKTVDWIGNNYGWETYSLYKDLTVIGANGATIDAVEIEGGTYYYTEHSQDDAYPVMLSLVELNNVVFDGVTFTGEGGYDPQGHGNVINLSGGNIKVDGLTLKNCVLEDSTNNSRLIYQTDTTTNVHNYTYCGVSFTYSPSLKNITVTGCTLNGGYMGLELRETENLTITNNTFNVADRNMLLPVNTGCTYTGTITITGNVSNNAQERFVRADGMGDAIVVISNNTINAYMGADADYIKVTNANNVTVENNVVTSIGANNAESLKNALINGGNIVLADDIVLSASIPLSNANFVLDGNGHTITMADDAVNTYALFDITGGNATIKNVTFDGIRSGAIVRTVGVKFNADNVTAINGEHTQQQGLFRLMGESTITNCTFKNNTCSMVITLNYDGANSDPQIVENCVFENNTCNGTAVVYYVKGAGCTLNGNKFLNNNVIVSGGNNAATVYMGFTENNIITNNVFEKNTVTAGTSKRVSGGLMIGYAATITGNAFIDNKVIGENAKGNDICASVYYTDIDLSGNYWGGEAPVQDDNYFVEYPDRHSVIIDNYLTTYDE